MAAPGPVTGRRRAGLLVVDYGACALIEENVARLAAEVPDALVVVVDNFHSPAESRAIAACAQRHGWLLLAPGRNLGFGAAANAGAQLAFGHGCDVLLLLNPDLRIDARTATELVAATRAAPSTASSPRILCPNGSVWFPGGVIDLDRGRTRLDRSGGRNGTPPADRRSPPWLTGACLAVHRDLWTAVGGFDGDYFLYWEDVDLSYRLLGAGAGLQVRHDLLAVHDVGGTQPTGGPAKSAAYYYFNCRNRLLFAAKHLDRRDRFRWLLRTPADVRRVLLRGGRRQFLAPWRNLWPAGRGAFAGLRAVLREAPSGPRGQGLQPGRGGRT